jgi:hypothetical protein
MLRTGAPMDIAISARYDETTFSKFSVRRKPAILDFRFYDFRFQIE